MGSWEPIWQFNSINNIWAIFGLFSVYFVDLFFAGSIAIKADYTGIRFNLTLATRKSVIVPFVLTNEKLPLAHLIKSEAPIGPFGQNKTDDD